MLCFESCQFVVSELSRAARITSRRVILILASDSVSVNSTNISKNIETCSALLCQFVVSEPLQGGSCRVALQTGALLVRILGNTPKLFQPWKVLLHSYISTFGSDWWRTLLLLRSLVQGSFKLFCDLLLLLLSDSDM